MPVLHPRTHLVSFRISEDEYQQFSSLCQSEGARSISGLVRSIVRRFIRDGSPAVETTFLQRLLMIDELIFEVNRKLQQLGELLAKQSDPQQSRAKIVPTALSGGGRAREEG